MKKFELCYETPENKDNFIAPQLLTKNELEYEWNDQENLILSYTYSDFMPKGIIIRFIVIMHQYIEENKYVWRNGVILNKDNTKAKIIENYDERKIKINIIGENKQNLMTIITYELDKISDSFNRLQYQKLIPCNCEACLNNPKPFNYDLNRLLKRLANNKLTIECDNPPYNEVQVLSLIDKNIDIEKYISQHKEDKKQTTIINNIERNIKINKGNYNEEINGDYYQNPD